MKLLKLIFVGLAAYGAYAGMWGGCLISLAMVGLMYYGQRVFAAQDQAVLNSPLHARKEPTTLELLDQQGCECSAPNFLTSIFKSDSEI